VPKSNSERGLRLHLFLPSNGSHWLRAEVCLTLQSGLSSIRALGIGYDIA
jgi:hypothetical protein